MQVPACYKVSRVEGEPVFDSLPVAKIIHYPLEKRDYRPFAQCIFCVSGQKLFVRMWAFEVSVMPTSALECVLCLYPDKPERAICLRVEHGGGNDVETSVRLLEDGKELPVDPKVKQAATDCLEYHPHNGEDLQGVYWGATLSLPWNAVEQLGGKVDPGGLKSFPGNFYKTCRDEKFAHYGSYFPAEFPQNPYGLSSMGAFDLIAY